MSFGTNAPEGFVENKSKISATDNAALSHYDIQSGYTTNIFTGDPVVMIAGGYIGQAVAGGPVCGVFKGVEYTATNGRQQWYPYWVANTTVLTNTPAPRAYVLDDPYVVFTIQCGSTPAIRASLNKNANFNLGTGNAYNGISGAYLDIGTVGTTATLNCKILGITQGFTAAMGLPPKNILGQAYNNVDVTFNNHQLRSGTGTAGV